MIAIVDYGVGNLYSLCCSLQHIGEDAVVTGNAEQLLSAEKVILPGVGAFGDAAQKLRDSGLFGPLYDMARKGKPLLGICLGMQLLFTRSFEYGEHQGLGLIPGEIRPLAGNVQPDAKVPHMGWNSLRFSAEDPILRGIKAGDYVYYVHSYYAADCQEAWVAFSDYGGVKVPGIVKRRNVYGTQFHPEKSGEVGLAILRNFAKEELAC